MILEKLSLLLQFLRQRPHEAARIVEELKSGTNEELIKARNRLLTMADEAAIQNAIKYDVCFL